MPKLTHKAFEKYGFAAAALITDWAQIVGKDVAAYTDPERLKWPRGVESYVEVGGSGAGRPGATLIVRVEPARALDMQYKAAQMMERINGYFGYRAVAELRILQTPIDAPAASAKPVQPPRPAHPKPQALRHRSQPSTPSPTTPYAPRCKSSRPASPSAIAPPETPVTRF